MCILRARATMEKRVEMGVKAELLPLIENVQGVGRIRGRLLFNGGYHDPMSILRADAETMRPPHRHPRGQCASDSSGRCGKTMSIPRRNLD